MELISNRYEIVALIGEGGMADVYLANDTLEKRQVAIKILRGELANDVVALVRFQREANAAATLAHQNIIQIYDVGNDNNRHYIVMEYVKGRTLKQWIAQRGALPLEEAVYIMRQITLAVQVAHEKGIIHRDIKPQNVMITDDGSIKITDFGIAMAQDALQLTVSESVMGSVHYLAPELAKGEPATYRSDIYSLGIVFYELLSGDVPYRADAPVQVALKHLREEMPSIRKLNPLVPQFVENIIIKATAKNKANRYSSCAELLYDLDRSEQIQNAEKLDFKEKGDFDKTKVAGLNKRDVKKMDNRQRNKRDFDDDYDYDRKKPIAGKIFIGLLLVILSIGAVVAVLYISGIMRPKREQVEIPYLLGVYEDEAKIMLEDLGLFVDVVIVREVTDDFEKGMVFETSPEAGTVVDAGSKVRIKVSEGMWATMPDYTGWFLDDAKQDLYNQQLTNVTANHQVQFDSTIPENKILKQTGLNPGDRIDPTKRYQVTFIISNYIRDQIPTGLVGATRADAEKALTNRGFKVEVKLVAITYDPITGDPEPLDAAPGHVKKVTPNEGAPYTQTEKSTVVLEVYK